MWVCCSLFCSQSYATKATLSPSGLNGTDRYSCALRFETLRMSGEARRLVTTIPTTYPRSTLDTETEGYTA